MPLHRSIAFWLGLPLPVFLLWAWFDSLRYSTSWERAKGDGRVVACFVYWGKFEFQHVRSDSLPPPGAGYILVITEPYGDLTREPYDIPFEAFGFAAPRFERQWEDFARQGKGTDCLATTLVLPFWLMLALYLPLWLALSLWRARRIAKARAAIANGVEA